MTNENPIYTMEYDESTLTREKYGVAEHKHGGFDYWHPEARMHAGCGRTDGDVESDVRMCLECDCYKSVSMCHTRRRQLGLTACDVAHGDRTSDMITHVVTIDRSETMMMIDEALSDIVSAKTVLECVGKNSEHVQQATFEQFTRSINEIVTHLLKISMCIEEEMNAARKRTVD